MKENIDRSVWINYFNEFTRRNQSRPTQLEVSGEIGTQGGERGQPFGGIALDSDSGTGTLPSVEIMLGGHDAIEPRHSTHVIANVQEITPKRGLDGRDEGLEIITAQGETSLLRFEPRAMIAA
jgi:hypothetical protein